MVGEGEEDRGVMTRPFARVRGGGEEVAGWI